MLAWVSVGRGKNSELDVRLATQKLANVDATDPDIYRVECQQGAYCGISGLRSLVDEQEADVSSRSINVGRSEV
jgi:hypothetical protein